jgi:hypothetical protein
MKLSEAIRQGCKIVRRTNYRSLISSDSHGYKACALGAALLGSWPTFIEEKKDMILVEPKKQNSEYQGYKYLRSKFPELKKSLKELNFIPVKGYTAYMKLEQLITMLNDYDKLPRYRIARLLESRGF